MTGVRLARPPRTPQEAGSTRQTRWGSLPSVDHRQRLVEVGAGVRERWIEPHGLLEVDRRFLKSAAAGQGHTEAVVRRRGVRVARQSFRVLGDRLVQPAHPLHGIAEYTEG